MMKAPTIKEAIKGFEERKGVVAAEVEKVSSHWSVLCMGREEACL